MATELKTKKCGNYVLKELFGSLKCKKPTQQILKEIRKDIEGKQIEINSRGTLFLSPSPSY